MERDSGAVNETVVPELRVRPPLFTPRRPMRRRRPPGHLRDFLCDPSGRGSLDQRRPKHRKMLCQQSLLTPEEGPTIKQLAISVLFVDLDMQI
ncbi:hypothetical protein PAMP_001061 [Pampus punctatissimus]